LNRDYAIDREPVAFSLGGDLLVSRLGYGNRQLTGPGIWGEPSDRPGALRLLRRAVELGVEFIDTADAYGPDVAESLTAEALYPYPSNLVIGTKAGMVRTGPGEWHPLGRPEYLRQQCELSLRRLRLERIDLYQLHRIDPLVAVEDQLGVLSDLQSEGKIRHIGLSEVSIDELRFAGRFILVASVQNRYNLVDRLADPVINFCERENIAFIPWFPLAKGDFGDPKGTLATVALRLGATPAQVALAWLLARSPVVMPIPGTASIPHLEENLGARDLTLCARDLIALQNIPELAS
jgi:pyridoxine 4-dehydrogenase